MKKIKNIFCNKKILIYGLGKSGLSTFNFLKNKSSIFLFDDYLKKIKSSKIKKKLINYKSILKVKFDFIIISPGIDINNCLLSKYLKKNSKLIFSDLAVFYSFFKNDCITITGTNGKSTTCQLLYEIFKNQKLNVKLVGNIGNPILSSTRINKKTIFIIEASSYQLEYSKIFKSKYAAILNISPDHIERHKTINNYVKAKFRLLKSQTGKSFAFLNTENTLINKEVISTRFNSKIINVNKSKTNNILKLVNNRYFLTDANIENLSFALSISKKFRIKEKVIIKTIKNFRGLKYRQQIIYKKKLLTIINDSKSTSFSSSKGILKKNSNIFWLLGGIPKKGDNFNLSMKYCKKIRAFIYGKKQKVFKKQLKGKIQYHSFNNIDNALKKILKIVEKQKFMDNTIIFSPAAASFDSFKNFEDRGFYFNQIIKKYYNE